MERFGVSHSRDDESWEAKVAWFRSLSAEERLAYAEEFVELALALNPRILEARDAHPIPGRVQVIALPQR